MERIENYINTAIGRTAPDLILKGGSVVDVFTGTVIRADVIIKDGIICGVGDYSGENEADVTGKYIMPGFVDAHVHIESSMTSPAEYAKAVMPHGITTVIADPHEITNVCGEDGLEYMKKASEKIPLDVKLMLPSCVPAAPFEHSGAILTAEDTKRLAPDFFGIGEMMNYPGILSCDSDTLGKLCSEVIDGHAPLLSGHDLDSYVSAGIKTDHECSNIDEMTEKISKGMYILLREGTLSLDVAKLIKGVTPHTLRRCAFCTDDRFVGEIIRDGSIDHCIRKAVSLGLEPIDAIIMASLNACEMYGMKKKGAIAPSYIADIVIADDLSLTKIAQVYKDGTLVCENGKVLFECETADTSKVINTVHLPHITADFFADTFADASSDSFNAIELIPESIITKKVIANKSDKLSKVCVIERHKNRGTKGIAYVTNYGITNGAIAASIGHDSHNVIVIGDNDSDMALAVNTLGKSGGIAVCSAGKVTASMRLDIAGLMSVKSANDVTAEHDALYKAAKDLNITDKIDPFLSLAFMPLPVIPEIRITDSGLFDVTEFKFI
ncbi:MAG: adenine deaminase [Hominilimicola sp.]